MIDGCYSAFHRTTCTFRRALEVEMYTQSCHNAAKYNTILARGAFNSLVSGGFRCNRRVTTLNLYQWCIFSISWEIALSGMLLDLIDRDAILMQIMTWWRQATSPYLSQWDKVLRHHMASLIHNILAYSGIVTSYGAIKRGQHCRSTLMPAGNKLLSLKQCWININEDFRHSPLGKFTTNAQHIYPGYECECCSIQGPLLLTSVN